jgi:hypothetical protein
MAALVAGGQDASSFRIESEKKFSPACKSQAKLSLHAQVNINAL